MQDQLYNLRSSLDLVRKAYSARFLLVGSSLIKTLSWVLFFLHQNQDLTECLSFLSSEIPLYRKKEEEVFLNFISESILNDSFSFVFIFLKQIWILLSTFLVAQRQVHTEKISKPTLSLQTPSQLLWQSGFQASYSDTIIYIHSRLNIKAD